VVSFGLSAQYTGTVFNQGGLYYSLVEPNHGNMENFSTTNLSAYQETVLERVGGRKVWITGTGIDAQEVQYQQNDNGAPNLAIYPYCQSQSISGSSDVAGGIIACILFTGTPGNTFEVEYVQHQEYIGASASALATPTHSDARGFEMVNTATNRMAQLKVSNPSASHKSLMDTAMRDVSHELKPYAMAGVKMVGAAALTALGNKLAGPVHGLGRIAR
jgi:hypothetical protein